MIIQHNLPALTAQRNLSQNNSTTAKNLEKLASGYGINRAGDNAAGLAISEKMRSQIRGLSMAEQNTSHAINLIQTAEGALQETHALLQRMRELGVQSANGTYDNEVDRASLNKEYDALKLEINRISESTQYNNRKLFAPALNRVASLTSDELNEVQSSAMSYGLTTVISSSGTFAHSISGNDTTSANFSLDFTLSPEGDVVALRAVQPVHSSLILTITGNQVEVREHGSNGVVLFEVHGDFFAGWDFAGGIVSFSAKRQIAAPAGGGLQFVATPANQFFKWEPGNALVDFQVGANGTRDQKSTLEMHEVDCAYLGIDGTGIDQQENANRALASLDSAINEVSAFRADLGAMHNRLEHTLNNLGVTRENLTAAESNIRDVDMAQEMMEYTKHSILIQASQAMLAQAQTLPQGILGLLA